MKTNRLFTAICLLAGVLLAGSCSQNELTDGMVQDLPEGMYPLQIASVSLTAESSAEPWGADAPQTRVLENTTDGNSSVWTDGDLITVQIGNDNTSASTYSVDVDASGNVTGLTAETALYWKNTTAQKVKGWYPTDITNDIDLKNQSTNLAYALYAETAGTVDYQTTSIELPFTHQLAKIRVVLDGSEKGNVTDVKVCTYPACKFAPTDATKIAGTGSPEYIPMKKTTYDKGVTNCWEANVVPGSILRDNAFWLVVDETPVECSITQVTPQAGQLHIITLTVTEKYKEVNVSSIPEGTAYTVSGKVHLKGDGTAKTLKLTMEANSKLLLENINITAPDNSNAITCEGNATITLRGENTLSGKTSKYGYSAILVNSGTLTINGNDGDKLTATGVGGLGYGAGIGTINGAHIIIKGGSIIAKGGDEAAGIGCAGFNQSGGDITIKGGIIEATGGKYSAGIGGSNSGSCGNIIITGGNIKAYGGLQSPGIGNGDYAHCGDITISGASTVVQAKKGVDCNNSIGYNGYNGSCGTVSIGEGCTVIRN